MTAYIAFEITLENKRRGTNIVPGILAAFGLQCAVQEYKAVEEYTPE